MSKQNHLFASLFLCSLLLISFTGCESGAKGIDPDLVPITGTVSLDGTSLASGRISFTPETGIAASTGDIKNGNFTLRFTASAYGAKPGKYKVFIESWSTPPGMDKEGKAVEGVSGIPKKYRSAATSGLTAEVTKEGKNYFTFKLKSK